MVLDRADVPAVRDSDDDRERLRAAVPVGELGKLRHDLVEARVDEAVELDLAHRPVSAHREADRGADDARLGKGRVEHAAVAEVCL